MVDKLKSYAYLTCVSSECGVYSEASVLSTKNRLKTGLEQPFRGYLQRHRGSALIHAIGETESVGFSTVLELSFCLFFKCNCFNSLR
jgi:hypothetical protein